jgi:hypothetical protein
VYQNRPSTPAPLGAGARGWPLRCTRHLKDWAAPAKSSSSPAPPPSAPLEREREWGGSMEGERWWERMRDDAGKRNKIPEPLANMSRMSYESMGFKIEVVTEVLSKINNPRKLEEPLLSKVGALIQMRAARGRPRMRRTSWRATPSPAPARTSISDGEAPHMEDADLEASPSTGGGARRAGWGHWVPRRHRPRRSPTLYLLRLCTCLA